MVRQRFLTHFKPWLYVMIRVGGVIAGYQLFDQLRASFEYPPLNIVDVVMAVTVALIVIGWFCAIWAWGEWCWFRLRRLRTSCRGRRRACSDAGRSRTATPSQPMTGRMV